MFLKIGLLVLGLSCGLSNPMSSIYITEIAGQDNKGMASSMFNFNLTFGVLLTNTIGSLTGYDFNFIYEQSIYIIVGVCVSVLP